MTRCLEPASGAAGAASRPCWRPSISAALLTLAIFGCGKNGPAVAPVEGTVSYRGQPVPTGSIILQPTTGRPAYGKIKDGRIIEVTTKQPGDGAPVGLCTITVQAFEPGKDVYSVGKPLVPMKYNQPQTSGLSTQIVAGQVNKLELNLED